MIELKFQVQSAGLAALQSMGDKYSLTNVSCEHERRLCVFNNQNSNNTCCASTLPREDLIL